MSKRLSNLDEKELEVNWLKIMPKKVHRQFSCICITCTYFNQLTEYAKMREHITKCVDSVIRKHTECGVIITGYFNQMNHSFLKTHYTFSHIVKLATWGQAICLLNKIWMNVNMVYSKPVTVAELGTSDHNMVLLKPSSKMTLGQFRGDGRTVRTLVFGVYKICCITGSYLWVIQKDITL